MAEEMDRIVPLDELDDFEVAEGDPDVRGWAVISADGRQIGEVDQLLVDVTAMKVRYLDVDLDEEELNLEEDADRHILIPIGFARLDEADDKVFVDNLQSDQVKQLPAYGHGPITREFETSVREGFGRGMGRAGMAGGAREGREGMEGREGREGEEFYAHEAYDEGRFYGGRRRGAGMEEREGERRITRAEEELRVGKREVEAGQVDIEKRVETEHVRRPVEVSHNEVDIERHPVREGMRGREARIGEEEVRVPLTEEELVVEKRPVVKEEMVVRKHPATETQQVEADLRRERLDVERHGRVEERGRGQQAQQSREAQQRQEEEQRRQEEQRRREGRGGQQGQR